MSPTFEYGLRYQKADVFTFAGLLSLAGGVYLLIFWFAPNIAPTRPTVIIIVLIGLGARAMFFGSTPIFEDDWYRYLWDGAVVNEGVNPYALAPARAMNIDITGRPVPLSDDPVIAKLQKLGAAEPHYPERIGYPFISTIYPPLAQAAFALSTKISPFNLDAWRAVLLGFDIISLWILLTILRRKNISALWAMLYWWNPIVIVTAFNAGHMDILMTPFLLGAVALAQFEKPRLAAVSLAGAIGVKLWPIILTPVLFRALNGDIKRIAATGAVLAITTAIIMFPMAQSFYARESGLIAYADGWRTNAFLFYFASEGAALIHENGPRVLRFLITAIVGAVALWMFFSRRAREIPLAGASSIIILFIFVIGPTGYPWYITWFVALAPLAPSIGIASFSVAIPMYYLRFVYTQSRTGEFFDFALTPIEFIPPILLTIWSLKRRRLWKV